MFNFLVKLFRKKPKKKLPNISKYKKMRKVTQKLPEPIEAPSVKRVN